VRTPTPERSGRRLLTVPQTAKEKLGVSIRQVYRLISQGDLRLLKVGRCARLLESDVDAYIEKLEGGAA